MYDMDCQFVDSILEHNKVQNVKLENFKSESTALCFQVATHKLSRQEL